MTPGEELLALLQRRGEMTTAFQPIVALADKTLLGFEALLRLPPGCGFAGPQEAFDAAADTSLLVDLEYAALETHLHASAALPDGRLFVNLSASAFLDPRMGADALAERIRAAGFAPERVVLEITELVRVQDPVAFAEALRPLEDHGLQLAVDDFGAGFSNVRLLVELGPEFLKIDRSLVSGAAVHPRKRVFLESMAALGRRINCTVIGEGVETPEDLATLRACGIPYAQGWGVVRPAPLEFFLGGLLLPHIAQPTALIREEPTVGAFSLPQAGIDPRTTVQTVTHLFDTHQDHPGVPILQGTRAIGFVTPAQLYPRLGQRFGFALWHDRPLSDLVLQAKIGWDRLPASASMEQAAELVRRRPASRRFEPVVVENERGDYHGILPVDVLLGEMTRLKVEYALHASPLTGLPGSVTLARMAEARLAAAEPFTLGWADVDDFKSFNDRYGFSRGDEVLRLLADVLRRHLVLSVGDFLAHPGGDDFAFIACGDDVADRAQHAAEDFGTRAAALYDEEDRVAGGIDSIDRQGRARRVGLVTLSIGLVPWNGERGVEYRRLVEIAAEVKGQAKRVAGPSVHRNARDLIDRPASPGVAPSVASRDGASL